MVSFVWKKNGKKFWLIFWWRIQSYYTDIQEGTREIVKNTHLSHIQLCRRLTEQDLSFLLI
jgi:hypothetical protein